MRRSEVRPRPRRRPVPASPLPSKLTRRRFPPPPPSQSSRSPPPALAAASRFALALALRSASPSGASKRTRSPMRCRRPARVSGAPDGSAGPRERSAVRTRLEFYGKKGRGKWVREGAAAARGAETAAGVRDRRRVPLSLSLRAHRLVVELFRPGRRLRTAVAHGSGVVWVVGEGRDCVLRNRRHRAAKREVALDHHSLSLFFPRPAPPGGAVQCLSSVPSMSTHTHTLLYGCNGFSLPVSKPAL